MLSCGNDVARSSLTEQFCPLCSIELFSLKHRDEVLVSELRLAAPPVSVCLCESVVHVLRVPLATSCRYRVNTPVDKNAELGILEPFWRAVVGGNRLPRGFVGPFGTLFQLVSSNVNSDAVIGYHQVVASALPQFCHTLVTCCCGVNAVPYPILRSRFALLQISKQLVERHDNGLVIISYLPNYLCQAVGDGHSHLSCRFAHKWCTQYQFGIRKHHTCCVKQVAILTFPTVVIELLNGKRLACLLTFIQISTHVVRTNQDGNNIRG